MNDVAIAAYKLRKAYRAGPKEVRAVDGIDLMVRRGRSVSITGPSGAGKSTLLHLLGGLDRPSEGSVLIDGLDIYRFSDAERSRVRNERIGFIFQFYHLMPELTAHENVMLPALIRLGRGRGAASAAVRDRARRILARVGLEGRAAHRPGELSGGESQRVAIARALINEPEVLLCDEPTGNLDSGTSESILELLLSLPSGSDTALVIVTHDQAISARTDEVVRLKDGRIV